MLLEAMAVGLPVAASAIPGPDEMIVEGVSGRLLPPGDAVALADALAALVAAPAGSLALGEKAREAVLADYGPDSLARRLSAVVDDIANRA